MQQCLVGRKENQKGESHRSYKRECCRKGIVWGCQVLLLSERKSEKVIGFGHEDII